MSWEILKWNGGTSLVVQWIRLWASTAEGMGSIPGQRTKIPHATQPKKKKRKIFNKINLNFESCPMIRCSWCIFSAEDPEKSGFIIVHNLVSAYLSVFLSDFSSHTRGRILEIFIFLLPFFQVDYFSWQFLPTHFTWKSPTHFSRPYSYHFFKKPSQTSPREFLLPDYPLTDFQHILPSELFDYSNWQPQFNKRGREEMYWLKKA